MNGYIPVLLDGDPGHDDAIAWVLANASPLLDIRAVTSVSGNQTIEKTTYNAGRILALIGLDVPLAPGRSKPLCGEAFHAPGVHGASGLDGAALPEPKRAPLEMDACTLMAKVLSESAKQVAIVATGPLTNVAALLLTYPRVKEKIRLISFMGGGLQHGNWSPAAEFNMLVDPEAADVVLKSGLPLKMAGLDVTERALVFPEDFARVRALGNPVSRVVADWLDFFYDFHRRIGYTGAPVHDAVAVTALERPDLLTTKKLYVAVETVGDYCRGATVANWNGRLGHAPNVSCALDINRKGFVDYLVHAVGTYGKGGGAHE